MYRGFDLELSWENNEYYTKGLELYDIYKYHIKNTLESFILNDGYLDGSKMQSNWFKQIDADIFISHSHDNRRIAISLAGWLYETFGIKSFIDSCIWGYSDNLLRLIDNKYCMQPDGNYNYRMRNRSTSHVHMMLSTALTMMMDKTECIFFLNTPSSIITSEVINQTESPWIYFELSMTKFLRENTPERLELHHLEESFSGADGSLSKGRGGPRIKYEVDLGHLTDLDIDSLIEWEKKYIRGSPLDKLYALNPDTKWMTNINT